MQMWLSTDPLAEMFPGHNPYNYCMQNPIMLTDPTGMAPEGGDGDPPVKGATTKSPNGDTLTGNGTNWIDKDGHAVDPDLYGIETVTITGKTKNASGVSSDSGWRYCPIIGSGLDSYDSYSRGEYWKGTAYLALAVSDVFLVKSLAVGAGKFAARQYAKASVQIADNLAAKGSTQLLLNAAPATLTQQGLEHIILRHWFTSGAKGAGKFAQGTTGASLKEMIHTATTKGTFRANTRNRAGTIAEYNFGRVIGTTSSGAPASNLRVIIGTNGNVISAFPY